MDSTSISLLQRLKANPQADDWQALMQDYAPLIRGWLKRNGASEDDSEDVSQEVMTVLVRRVAEFQRQRTGSFRKWVRTITYNCLRDHWRRERRATKAVGGSDMQMTFSELEDDHSELSQRWDSEHEQYLLGLLLTKIRAEFKESTWQAFSRLAIEKLSPKNAANQLGVSVNSVLISKSRVLKRLKEEGAGLIDN